MLSRTSLLVIFFIVATSVMFTSCKSNGSSVGNKSRATGFEINSSKGGFQYNSKYKGQITPIGMVLIEGGTFTKGKVQDDVLHDWNNSPTQQHVMSFYMDESEVTNVMYLEYLDWLKQVFPPSNPNYRNIYAGALPDSLVWLSPLGYNDVLVNNYLRHPAYAQYPVVGVNWIQAVQFCDWRTDRYNENLLIKNGYLDKEAYLADYKGQGVFTTEGYLQRPETVYGGQLDSLLGGKSVKDTTYASRSTGVFLPDFRLPTESEWEYAAMSLGELRDYNSYRGKKKYPWEGEFTRNGNQRVRGEQLANFKLGKGDYGGISGWSDDGGDITVPVMSYKPNDYGLYDMAGNVNEWVADVYRPIVDDELSDFNYYRGNIYTKTAIGEDGEVVVVDENSIVYDTLSDGRIIALSYPGKVKREELTDDDLYLRPNVNRSDNRAYYDGDLESSRYHERFIADSDKVVMYNAPQHNIERDSLGNLIKQYDKSSSRTTLVSDEVRVYKGGSWRDRAFWLDPAQRRYLPEYMATNDLGFRCAISRVGPRNDTRKKRRD